jgi:hypothetical protein
MYKVIKDVFVSARIKDGKELFKGMLSQASQEQLEELSILGIKYIQYTEETPKKRSKKIRDNNPSAEVPMLKNDDQDVQEYTDKQQNETE